MSEAQGDTDQCRCRGLFLGHYIEGELPLVVLECLKCGRLWHQRDDKQLVPYDERLFPQLRRSGTEERCRPVES